MAATIKFNRLCETFMLKIGDPIEISGNVIGAGKVITTKEKIQNYINRALETFFAAGWKESGYDVDNLANAFPELIKSAENGTLGDGICSIEAFGNLFKIFSVRVDGKYCAIWDMTKYGIAKSRKRIQYLGSSDNPGVIHKDTYLEFFGAADSDNVDFEYIIKPLKSDGTAFVSSNDGEDSPYNEFWNEQIAQIATELYNQDAQNLT